MFFSVPSLWEVTVVLPDNYILDECRAMWGEPEQAESMAQQQSCSVVAREYCAWVLHLGRIIMEFIKAKGEVLLNQLLL